ncbi:MAG: RNase H family protein, partial [Acidimicrobiia bacterium]
MTRTRVYTDGACSGNPGPGGWAWIIPDGAFAAGADNPTTNQRMELAAVLDAVRTLEGPLEIVSDSTYVVICFRDRWWEGWIARGWVNSQRKPVATRDLW